MSAPINPAHTPGAMRAATEIVALSESTIFSPGTRARLAEIIDRETAAPEMLSALRNVHQHMLGMASYLATCSTEVIIDNLETTIRTLHEKLARAEAAIQKAQGGQ